MGKELDVTKVIGFHHNSIENLECDHYVQCGEKGHAHHVMPCPPGKNRFFFLDYSDFNLFAVKDCSTTRIWVGVTTHKTFRHHVVIRIRHKILKSLAYTV